MTHRHLRGFTLLELMIAIGLGILIIYIALAAFRTASQSIAVANKLAMENSILCAGMQIARNQIDFWTGLDDPHDPNKQGLRALVPAARSNPPKGGPFTPFSAYWAGNYNDTDNPMGFDPRDTSWSMGNPRMWWRGNLGEKNDTALAFGRYGVFSNSIKTLNTFATVPIMVAIPNPPPGGATTTTQNISYGQVTVPHCWLASQMQGISRLGFYGYIDYMPPNAVYSWYDPFNSSSTKGGYSKEFIGPGGSFNTMYQKTPKGMARLSTLNTCYAPDPEVYTTPANMTLAARRTFNVTQYGGNLNTVNGLLGATSKGDNFIDSGVTAPETWPHLTVLVHRFYQHAFAVNLARIQMIDPITGESKELSFAGFGTSLRGARQQRHPGGGWAKWDNAPGFVNDKNLDY